MTAIFRRSPRFLLLGAAAAVAVFATAAPGCGSSGSQVPLYPTTGQVLFQGKPLAGVQVIFKANQPNGPSTASIGLTDVDGKFTLSTPSGESGQVIIGVPAGNYLVAIVPPTRTDSGDFLNKGSRKLTPNLVKDKYADPKTSGLKASIKVGKNVLEPFIIQ